MRLNVLETKHRRLKYRIMFKLMPLLMRVKVPDVAKVITFRDDYFGDRFTTLLQEAMRGESEWSPAQRELFAAFTARVHECKF